MVTYKLYLEGLIDHNQWKSLSGLFRTHWLCAREEQRERNRERDGGPSSYVVSRTIRLKKSDATLSWYPTPFGLWQTVWS
jgi:hypothetical protein